MKKHRAFTLAEVLVVMAIISIIAVLVTPMIRDTVPNKEMVMFKKAYFLTSRAVNELINDEDFYPEDPTGQNEGFAHVDLIATRASDRQATYHGVPYVGPNKFCGLFATKLNIRGDAQCNNARVNLLNGRGDVRENAGNFVTSDGIMWSMPINNFPTTQTISVDVNGINPPNCGETTGDGIRRRCRANDAPDQFKIQVDRDGTITVPSAYAREYLSSQKTNRRYKEIRADVDRRGGN